MFKKTGFLFLLISLKVVAQQPDTLFLEFSKDLINKSVFINKIDVFGGSIKGSKKEKLVFLFTNSFLRQQLQEKIKSDSLAAIGKRKNPNLLTVKGYSAGPPQFGIQFNYYQLDSLDIKSYNKTVAYYMESIEGLKKYGATKEQIANHRKELIKTLSPPLTQIFANEDYMRNKTRFKFTGTKDNYKKLKEIIDEFNYIFIVIPHDFSILYGYKYELVQVKRRYIRPGL